MQNIEDLQKHTRGNLLPKLDKIGKPWLIVGIVFLIASFTIRLMTIENSLFWHDEAITMCELSGISIREYQDRVTDNVWKSKDLLQEFQSVHRVGPELIIANVYVNEPLHAPFYFIIQYYWNCAFGNSVAVNRLPALIFSLLQLPVFYWLAWEMTRTRLGAFICTMFVGLSPWMLIYAQSTRFYSLMYVLLPLLCALFFLAYRSGKMRYWIAFGLLAVLSWYTTLLTGAILGAQALFLISQHVRFKNGKFSTHEIKRVIAPVVLMLMTFVLAIFFYIPTFHSYGDLKSVLSTFQPIHRIVPKKELFDSWLYGPFSLFAYGPNAEIRNLLMGICILIFLFGVVLIYRFGNRRVLLFCAFLVFGVALLCHIPDFVLGGTRSTVVKYMPGIVITVFILTSYGLVLQMMHQAKSFQLMGRMTFLCIMIIELASSYAAGMDPEREHPRNAPLRPVINTINTLKPDLVIDGDKYWLQILAMVHYLDPDTKILFTRNLNDSDLEYGLKTLVLYDCTKELKNTLKERGYTLSKVDQLNYLWVAKLRNQ
ncbi:MAG: hypothetical protein K2X29_04490 [Candidatus Obscuribacterales bacterium]|nr:hypothetical protein [Candidatus Obscuribacterales bacterium]